MNFIPDQNDFWFLPLGGAGEIGMNLNLFGHNNEWLMVDLGITFYDKLGIDVQTPDPSFIENHKHLLKGLVVTHAHEDHIGAIPYLWPFLECPIYATPFTAEIIKNKLAEKPWGKKVPLHIIPMDGKFSVGSFDIEYITLTHSIPEPTALAITTSLGTIIHTGDWKIDPNPVIGQTTDFKKLEEFASKGVLALVCDSTNVFMEGSAGSELSVQNNLVTEIHKHTGKRVAVACFASNVARLASICEAAQQTGRDVALVGKSLHRMVAAARAVGAWPEKYTFIDETKAMSYPKDKILLITTGSQGEYRAALARIANNQHPFIKLESEDVVIFSSRVIPGNEKIIGHLQNKLAKKGVLLVTAHEDIHVSGHPGRDELKQMYDWVKPNCVIPVHGEFRHMDAQARLAKEHGIKNTLVPENGTIVQMRSDNFKIIDRVDVGRLGLDGNSLVSMDAELLKARTKMAVHGAVFITHDDALDDIRSFNPKITFMGILETPEEQETISKNLIRFLKENMNDFYTNKNKKCDHVEMLTRQFCSRNFDMKPIVVAHAIPMGR
jgi:ribonuclease J